MLNSIPPYFNLHTHHFSGAGNVLELVNQYPWEFDAAVPWYSIGIHPWYIKESRLGQDIKTVDEKLILPECLALGECGLDKRIKVAFELQKEVFIKQIALAEKHQKPLVLHCVAAFQELIELKRTLKVSVPMIIHGFSKNKQLAKQLLDNGFYLSFGKYLLRNPEMKRVLQSVPGERFFLETDTMKESLEEIYKVAAGYTGLEITELQDKIRKNFERVFVRKS